MENIASDLQEARQQVASGALDACSDASLIAWERQIIDASSFCVTRMRGLRNSRAPINRLPNELLVQIFLTLSHICRLGLWLPVVQLCSRWRTLALSTPNLWTSLDHSWKTPLLKMMLQRSGIVPLSIRSSRTLNANLFCQTFRSHAHRIRRLHMDGSESSTVMAWIGSSMSTLEDLTIFAETEGSDATPLPPLLKLRALVVGYLNFDRILPWLRSLRRLELLEVDGIPDFHSLLSVLEACPLLEDLSIDKSLPWVPDDENRAIGRPVSLSKLKRFSLTDTEPPEVGYLCSHLIIPADATVTLGIFLSDGHLPPFSSILPENLSYWPAIATAESLQLSEKAPFSVILARKSRSTPSSDVPVVTLHFQDEYHNIITPSPLSSAMEQCTIAFASRNIIKLSIDGIPPWECDAEVEPFDEGLLPSVLASFPGLQSLNLRCRQDVKPLFNALGTALDSESARCANLTSLRISGHAIDASSRDALRNALQFRASRGTHFDRLTLGEVPLQDGHSEFIETLKELVEMSNVNGTSMLGRSLHKPFVPPTYNLANVRAVRHPCDGNCQRNCPR